MEINKDKIMTVQTLKYYLDKMDPDAEVGVSTVDYYDNGMHAGYERGKSYPITGITFNVLSGKVEIFGGKEGTI